ncbi:RTA1-domain-containing protein [Xylariomycetidae sp. FL2044]|nr:RTA1-domain-containing protein [Xylariomycetidae sp. FL2044]
MEARAERVSYKMCTEVMPGCPVEATVLGYYPNLGLNAFFTAGFGVCMVVLAVTGVWKKTWGYSAALTAGCILEFAGYLARVFLHQNPWNSPAFQTQICAIILAPTLLCISIYLTLKHITLSLSPSLSRVRPRLYPVIFVPADVSCLLLQAIGGGLAASAGSEDPDLLLAGDRVIIAGIALQCVVLGGFGAAALDYFLRVRKVMMTGGQGGAEGDLLAEGARQTWEDGSFRLFVYAVTGAYGLILIRCIYRIAEMAGGWGNHIMQDEPSFVVLESFCILIPVALLTFFPPGFLFPAMAERERQRLSRKSKNKSNNKRNSGGAGDETATSGDEGQKQVVEEEKEKNEEKNSDNDKTDTVAAETAV